MRHTMCTEYDTSMPKHVTPGVRIYEFTQKHEHVDHRRKLSELFMLIAMLRNAKCQNLIKDDKKCWKNIAAITKDIKRGKSQF